MMTASLNIANSLKKDEIPVELLTDSLHQIPIEIKNKYPADGLFAVRPAAVGSCFPRKVLDDNLFGACAAIVPQPPNR